MSGEKPRPFFKSSRAILYSSSLSESFFIHRVRFSCVASFSASKSSPIVSISRTNLLVWGIDFVNRPSTIFLFGVYPVIPALLFGNVAVRRGQPERNGSHYFARVSSLHYSIECTLLVITKQNGAESHGVRLRFKKASAGRTCCEQILFASAPNFLQTSAHTKAIGSTKLGRDSIAKRLGVKRKTAGAVTAGEIIIRQRGTSISPA